MKMNTSNRNRFIAENLSKIEYDIMNKRLENPADWDNNKKLSNINQYLIGLIYDMSHPRPVIKVKRTESAKRFPLIHVAKDGDVGMDLPAVLDEHPNGLTVSPNGRVVVPTGIYLELPKGYWASIEARSSTSKQMMLVPKGVIDEGYRGELFAVLINVGSEPVVIHDGDRYVQLILHKREIDGVILEEVEELSKSERGTDGFGSTGRTATK